MSALDESQAGTANARQASETVENQGPQAGAARRLPFSLSVAAVWTSKQDLMGAGDGQLRYWRQAPLTGQAVVTSAGHDVSFSDLEVE